MNHWIHNLKEGSGFVFPLPKIIFLKLTESVGKIVEIIVPYFKLTMLMRVCQTNLNAKLRNGVNLGC